MTRSGEILKLLAAGCVLSFTATGCITIAPNAPSFSLKSLTKSKVQQASFEEKVEEVPSEPKNPAKLKLAYGQLMEESGQLAEARKQYVTVTEIQPKNVEAILGIARLDQLSGNISAAQQGFEKAVKLAPGSAVAQYSLGQFYGTQERWDEAAEALTKAMLAEPNESQYRYALAVALAHRGDIDSALPHFIRTIGDAEAHYNVGLILKDDGKLEEAERQFTLAVTKKPQLTQAQDWLAQVRQLRAGQPAPATDRLDSQSNQIVPASHKADMTTTQAVDATAAPAPSPTRLSAQQLEQLRNQTSESGT